MGSLYSFIFFLTVFLYFFFGMLETILSIFWPQMTICLHIPVHCWNPHFPACWSALIMNFEFIVFKMAQFVIVLPGLQQLRRPQMFQRTYKAVATCILTLISVIIAVTLPFWSRVLPFWVVALVRTAFYFCRAKPSVHKFLH